MLDKTTQDAIGREMRRIFEQRPKGGIPDRIWRLLVAVEAATPSAQPERRTSEPRSLRG